MKNLFEELWYGNIAPIENIKATPEIENKRKEIAQIYDKLIEKINDVQKTIFTEYDELNIELESLYEVRIFEYAFKLGANFAIEMLKE